MNLFQPRTAFFLTLLVSIAALGSALVAQFGFGLKPCVMCLWQRLPYLLLIAGSLVACVAKPRSEKILLLIFAALFLCSAGLAFFHFGIEQHWWSLENGCKVGEVTGKTDAEVLAQILATPQAECDKVAWRVLGLSITVWNTALSLAMAGYLLLTAAKQKNS